MTLATLTPSDKSTLASKQAAQAAAARESLQRIDTFAAQLKTIVQAAAQTAESIDHTERAVRDTVQKMGKQAIELFIQLQGHGDLGETVLNRLPDPLPESEAKLLVTSVDCKGVPLVKEDSAKVAAFETAEKNPGNRRTATVASVYTVDPHVRTAEHITAALVRDDRDDSKEKIKRPRP